VITKLTINPRMVNFADIVNEVVDRMQEAASQVSCKLTSSVRTQLVGNFDSLRIGQMLTNLLSNAFKRAGTDVEVELESSDAEIVLRVHDRGPGIEAAAATNLRQVRAGGREPVLQRAGARALCRERDREGASRRDSCS
jgi:signal transduction histidine kinase